MGIVRTAFFLVGMTVGAGFLTGAELVRFFRAGGAGAFALSCLVSCVLNTFFLVLGRRHGGFGGAMAALFGRAGDAVGCILLALSFVPCAGMLAAFDALFPALSPLASLTGLGVVLLFLQRGMRGVSLLNVLLVPVLIGCILLFGGGELPSSRTGTGDALLYSFMNAAFSAPALMDAGRQVYAPVRSGLLAGGCVFVCGILVLGASLQAGAAAMPFLAAAGSLPVLLVTAGAVLNSLSVALLPLFSACERYAGRAKNAAKGILLLAAFLLSRLGFSGVIGSLYPAVGVFGAAFSALCVLHEYLLQKHDQRIHSRRQKAEEKGRAHRKVKFEHLPAVHDQIAKSRARDNVFSHDGADPRHANTHFEHGDEGGVGGGQHQLE